MRLCVLYILLPVLLGMTCWAQTVEPSSGVGRRSFQIELESLYMIEKEGREQVRSWSVPSTLFRYGIFEGLEAQLNIPFIDEKKYTADELVSSRQLFDRAQLGFSLDLWTEKGPLPEAAFMYRALIPVREYQSQALGHLISLNLSNTIGERIVLGYNLGWLLDEEEQLGYYIVNLSYEVNSLFHCFVEVFGEFIQAETPSTCVNTGIGFCFTDSLSLDLSCARGIDHDMVYFGGNLSYCFDF